MSSNDTAEALRQIKARLDDAPKGLWARVKPVFAKYWTIGKISNHTAYPFEGVDALTAWVLIEHAPTDIEALVAVAECALEYQAHLRINVAVGQEATIRWLNKRDALSAAVDKALEALGQRAGEEGE